MHLLSKLFCACLFSSPFLTQTLTLILSSLFPFSSRLLPLVLLSATLLLPCLLFLICGYFIFLSLFSICFPSVSIYLALQSNHPSSILGDASLPDLPLPLTIARPLPLVIFRQLRCHPPSACVAHRSCLAVYLSLLFLPNNRWLLSRSCRCSSLAPPRPTLLGCHRAHLKLLSPHSVSSSPDESLSSSRPSLFRAQIIFPRGRLSCRYFFNFFFALFAASTRLPPLPLTSDTMAHQGGEDVYATVRIIVSCFGPSGSRASLFLSSAQPWRPLLPESLHTNGTLIQLLISDTYLPGKLSVASLCAVPVTFAGPFLGGRARSSPKAQPQA